MLLELIQREIDYEILDKCMAYAKEQKYDLTCIFSIGTDGRIHIMDHSKNIPDCLSDDIEMIESDTSDEVSAPGVYKGKFRWDSCRDFETGHDEGYFILSEDSELLYEITKINEVENEKE